MRWDSYNNNKWSVYFTLSSPDTFQSNFPTLLLLFSTNEFIPYRLSVKNSSIRLQSTVFLSIFTSSLVLTSAFWFRRVFLFPSFNTSLVYLGRNVRNVRFAIFFSTCSRRALHVIVGSWKGVISTSDSFSTLPLCFTLFLKFHTAIWSTGSIGVGLSAV